MTTTASKPKTERARYEPHAFEAEWQRRWEAEGLYRAEDFSDKPKYYLLDFFPYPSGDGLSVGHSKNYVPTDAASRFLRMRGYNVLHPMGWDAFGLPAENEAIIRQVHPQRNTARNVANYKRQMNLQGLSYDWSREVNASSPDYYRWTQWLFLLMYERGLAYRAVGTQWWCPQCMTILANEQVENGFCWRHGDQPVERKQLEQWYFRITDYADELLESLDGLQWPDRIIAMQRNWIGRREGAEIEFTARAPDGSEHPLRVFTTRPDTMYGATFMVLSPEHPLVETLTAPDHKARVVQYQQVASRETEIARLSTEREKTGVPLGTYAVNPFTAEQMPLWIADYVLMGYGTGAIMAVPAHDERDFAFARRYSLPVRQVVAASLASELEQMAQANDERSDVYAGTGFMVNSGEFTDLPTDEGTAAIIAALDARGIGRRAISYRMRDWLVSRQRYWGPPIPIVYCDACGIVPVPADQLPVLLPDLERFEPSGDGRSPLATDPEFVNTTCPRCGGPGRRETDTLDTFVDSSWYYLRFTSPHDESAPFDPAKMRYWTPIDLYVGGAEHAVMHLLYFRFFAKVLNDAGLIDFREPTLRLKNQGTMHAPDGLRMSKSRGNVVTPDSVVAQFSADALRCYVMFMGPFDADAIWDETGINGIWRWLNRVWDLSLPVPVVAACGDDGRGDVMARALHKTIKRVTDDYDGFRWNTAISALMELTNLLQRERSAFEGTPAWQATIDTLLLLMAPIAPFMTEELWHRRGHTDSIHSETWPTHDPDLVVDDTVTVAVQVGGKLRDTVVAPKGAGEDTVRALALESENVQRHVLGRKLVKVVFVPDRLLNLVVR